VVNKFTSTLIEVTRIFFVKDIASIFAYILVYGEYVNTPIMPTRRTVDPLRPRGCEVSVSIGVFEPRYV
jgi:hypothetical protein